MKKIPQVLFTNNLEMFKFSDVNRRFDTPLSKNRIKRISQSMEKEGLKIVPIIVTSKLFVVDGQHRVEAAKLAGCGVYYIIDYSIRNTPKDIFDAARQHNQYGKDWGKNDYINGLSNQGNDNYTQLEQFRKDYPMFSLSECIMLLMNSGTRYINKMDFAEGKFQVMSYKMAKEWGDNILSLKPYFEKGYNRSVFVRTLMTIVEKKPQFDFSRFYHKMLLNPSKMKLCGDKTSYCQMIEDIYNFKSRGDDKLNLRF
jgi:hypothetical protein